jgi:hypothetical protein
MLQVTLLLLLLLLLLVVVVVDIHAALGASI